MKHKTLELTQAQRAELERIVKRGTDWRARDRARTLLLFAAGMSAKDIVKELQINLDTAYDRRKHWLASGLESLTDKPRSGAPGKLHEKQQEKLKEWATTHALTTRQLLTRLQEEFEGVQIHPSTVGQTLKRMNFTWKRTRHSLKKNATP